MLSNRQIAELLARAAEGAKQPLQKALRRASRKALLWPEEVSTFLTEQRSLEELPGVGPSLSRIIRQWIDDPPSVPQPPEIRRHFLTPAQAHVILANRPEWARQYKGDLQMHSNWSDGTSSIEEMAEAGDERGYEYIAITDHSKGLPIAGGIDEQQLRRQAEEIAATNEKLDSSGKRVRVLRSIELNLSPTGQGDMDKAALAGLDLVVGSFHSALRRKDDQTMRYIAALRNPSVHILGHPRGRIYNFRLGLQADWNRVFAEAAKLDKAVEIDAYPDRQDLSADLLKIAKEEGCRIAIDTDAHGPSQLRFVDYGLAAAAKAGVAADRIINFMSRAALLAWAKSKRG